MAWTEKKEALARIGDLEGYYRIRKIIGHDDHAVVALAVLGEVRKMLNEVLTDEAG